MIRNEGGTGGCVERSLESDNASKGRPKHLEAQYNSTSSPPRRPEQSALDWTPRPHTKSDFDVPYMVGKIFS
jgi:hypothetical protein